jgi:hypothetical protein
MKHLIGNVKSNLNIGQNGTFKVTFPDHLDGREVDVVYTSPYCRANAGGLIAIPEEGTQVICLYNEDPYTGKKTYYYQTSVIEQPQGASSDDINPDTRGILSTDSKAKIFGDKGKPVTQTFTNSAGAGVLINREYAPDKVKNNVTLKAESGNEVNVGTEGVYLRNNEGDSIVLTGGEPNDSYAAKSLNVKTQLSQEYKCESSDITMKIVDGGDLNIKNTSTGSKGMVEGSAKWTGNVRLVSENRNIDLVAQGTESYVNILTQGATIQVDSQGTVKIFGQGSIQLESPQDISLNAGSNVNIYGGAGVQVGSGGTVSVNGTSITHNSIPLQYSAGAPGSDYTNSTPVLPAAGSPPAGTQFVPNDYNDPTGIA